MVGIAVPNDSRPMLSFLTQNKQFEMWKSLKLILILIWKVLVLHAFSMVVNASWRMYAPYEG